MTLPSKELWRAFPWDPKAPAGERFSITYVPALQGKGRFDLPGVPGGVLYLAETPEHAVAEMIQHYRGQVLDAADLRIAGQPLALVALRPSMRIRKGVVDLCDPEVLARLGVRPDETASRERRRTQGIAARIHAAGNAGLRWWSALSGDWHTVILFRDRLGSFPAHGTAERLTLEHTAVREAARILGVGLGGR